MATLQYQQSYGEGITTRLAQQRTQANASGVNRGVVCSFLGSQYRASTHIANFSYKLLSAHGR